MEIWYKTHPHLLSLSEVEVTRHSKDSIWEHCPALFEGHKDLEKKEKKHSNHSDYWPTAEEAVNQLQKQAEKQKDKALEELEEANSVLDAIFSNKLKVRTTLKQEKLPKYFKIIV